MQRGVTPIATAEYRMNGRMPEGWVPKDGSRKRRRENRDAVGGFTPCWREKRQQPPCAQRAVRWEAQTYDHSSKPVAYRGVP
jgi:hypothetical protein